MYLYNGHILLPYTKENCINNIHLQPKAIVYKNKVCINVTIKYGL